MMKHLLSITDLSAKEISELLRNAVDMKTELKSRGSHAKLPFERRSMAMIFDKSSLSTRLSFEVGMTQLGGHAVYLAPDDIKLGKRESVHDTAVVISGMADVIVARVSGHEDVKELAAHSAVPVVNAMTDAEHPCQALADLQTIYEEFGTLEGIRLAYVGDADSNVSNSLALAAETLGMELSVAAPEGYGLGADIRRRAKSVRNYDNPEDAVKGAHVVITDTWVSMGKEAERDRRLEALGPFQVTPRLMELADKKAIFMHCLPAYRGKEVAAKVIDGPRSRVFEEAENRLHAQKALLLHLMGQDLN
jgi:ornithine carbamoyltransferase